MRSFIAWGAYYSALYFLVHNQYNSSCINVIKDWTRPTWVGLQRIWDLRKGRLLTKQHLRKRLAMEPQQTVRQLTMKLREHLARRINWMKRLRLRKNGKVGASLGMENELFLQVAFETPRHWTQVSSSRSGEKVKPAETSLQN